MGQAPFDEEALSDQQTINNERPPIPSAFEPGEVYQTPLPILSMIVLSITMLGEFLSANVSTPFLLFMVRSFGELQDEAQVAFWTGVIVSSFFLTQFLTSLLWATVAEKYGRRFVLSVSLFGSAIAVITFGTSTSIRQAISIRLLQGIFAGAVGVARGSVGFMTDATNEGRAYAILGFCWGLGGVVGAIIGGSFERPADKWPGVFSNVTLFVKYPYLFPCMLAALITFTGSFLSLFLSREGGPREGAIRLPEKDDHKAVSPIPEEESVPPSPIFGDEEQQKPTFIGSLRKKISGPLRQKFSGYFAPRVSSDGNSPAAAPTPPPPTEQPPVPLAVNRSRFNGSAYGYAGSYRSRLASNTTARRPSVTSSVRRRRGSNYYSIYHDRENAASTSDMNFAQRLLLANENAVTNIADLWVAAAINADNEDPFESESEIEDESEALSDSEFDAGSERTGTSIRGGRSGSASHGHPRLSLRASGSLRVPMAYGSPRRPSAFGSAANLRSASQSREGLGLTRQSSFTSNMPAIFAHPGVKTPPAVLDAQQLLLDTQSPPVQEELEPILESRRTSQVVDSDPETLLDEKKPSLFSVIPMAIVIQYGLLALHTTTHDQVFMSYLVSDYEAGGLHLNAGHFAQLIAMMSLAQIAYQFYLYPNIGPPRGRFSHLAMFRIGSLLFIPSYLTVVLYRPFGSAEDDGNFLLMTALAISTAVRFCGITFAYTSISILLNYMTPPSAVGYANGIAQSIVSLARFFGPVLGGWLWSASIEGNPSGYPIGFIVCATACGLAVFQSLFIR